MMNLLLDKFCGLFGKHISSIIELISKTDFARYEIRKRIIGYICGRFLDKFLRRNNGNYSLGDNLCFKKAVNTPSFRGFLLNSFFNNTFQPTTLDACVALSISTQAYYRGFDVENIINLSSLFVEELNRELNENIILTNLVLKTSKKLKNISFSDTEDVRTILSDKKKIFVSYFNTYQNDNFTSIIKIYHSGEGKSWIDWKEDECLDIRINYAEIVEGFFLVGFDYKKEDKWLSMAVNKDGFEFFNEDVEGGIIVWCS